MQTMLIMTAGLVILGHVLPSLRHFGANREIPSNASPCSCASGNPPLSSRLWRRASYGSGQFSLSVNALLLWWIWQSYRDGLWSPSEVGLTPMYWPLGLSLGAATYAIQHLLKDILTRIREPREKEANRKLRDDLFLLAHNMMRSGLPRNPADRTMVFVSDGLLNPVTEEFLTAGCWSASWGSCWESGLQF
jgi:hypothetical protein